MNCEACDRKLVHGMQMQQGAALHLIYCLNPPCYPFQGKGDTREKALADLEQQRAQKQIEIASVPAEQGTLL